MKALLVIDVQNDFMPNGALPVPGGDSIIEAINRQMEEFELVVATQDWHPPAHHSFASTHPGKQPFDEIQTNGHRQTLWPDHCVQGSWGADFHQDLDLTAVKAIFRKGFHPFIDSYSAFYDNHHESTTGLAGYLREMGVDELYFSGVAADVCVYFSICDALDEGFRCCLLESATKALDDERFQKLKAELGQRGVQFL